MPVTSSNPVVINAGKSTENRKDKEENNAIQKAQKARHSLTNPNQLERLHNKYKR